MYTPFSFLHCQQLRINKLWLKSEVDTSRMHDTITELYIYTQITCQCEWCKSYFHLPWFQWQKGGIGAAVATSMRKEVLVNLGRTEWGSLVPPPGCHTPLLGLPGGSDHYRWRKLGIPCLLQKKVSVMAKICVSWDITPCSSAEFCKRFRETQGLHFVHQTVSIFLAWLNLKNLQAETIYLLTSAGLHST
jgi:hypothetical protein